MMLIGIAVLVGVVLGSVAVFAVWAIVLEVRRPHQHRAHRWDGYYEHCSCGACSGDVRDPETGLRCISFAEWPEAEEVL